MLVHLQYDGLLEYGDEGLRGHVSCYRASPTDFVLKLHRVEIEDSGMYWCKVTEWQPHSSPGMWVSQASDESQHVVFPVLPSGNEGLICPGSWSGESLSPPLWFPPSYVLLKATYRFPKERDFAISLESNRHFSFGRTRSA